ncbi:MAG: hypothetical protein QG656_282 [Candidatus Hydrogenedentes bacterium]|nr:hypothetical protein [Candidatus Hydrogenedentota bacterium]
MSLRVKIELILVALVGLIVALGYWFQREIVLPGLIPLEQKEAEDQMSRCFQGLRDEIAMVDAQCGAWVETIDLGQQVSAALLEEKRLDAAFGIDARGNVLWGIAMDSETRAPIAIEEFDLPTWPADSPLLTLDPDEDPVSGIVLTDFTPLLVASWPVREGAGENAPVTGCLVTGRFLSRELVRNIQNATGIPFQVWPLNKPLPRKARSMLSWIVQPFKTHVEEKPNEEEFDVYATYPGVNGQPAVLFQRTAQRGVFPKAMRAIQWGLLAQLVIGLVSLAAMVVLLRIILMKPLEKLIRHVTAIGRTQDLSVRLGLKRDDEIGVLAREFDGMVARLEEEDASRRLAQESQRESEERLALAMRGANDGLWDWNLKTNRVYFSPRWKSMLGYAEDEIGDSPDDWFNLIHPDDLGEFNANLDTHIQGQSGHLEHEHRILHKDTTWRWMLCRGVAVRDERDTPTRIAGSQTDITVRKLAEEQLAHDAFHDALTQLPNRALFLDRLGQAMRRAKRYEEYQFAVLFLDLDRFKVVNDGLGHLVGDELLREVSRKLVSCLRDQVKFERENDTVARFGGDEFVILLNDIRDIADAIRVAERIQESFKTPLQVGPHEVFTSASIGIALSATGYDQPEEFLRNADTAMYRAKAQGKARHEVFDADMYTQALARMTIETDLRRSVDLNEFLVYYQPIVDLRNGTITAFEALVRWNHPERGIVSPVEFIPIAEETGLILPIGQWVLAEACRQVQQWHEQIPTAASIIISVNLSTKQFQQKDLLGEIARVLEQTGLEPHCLKIEITESAIMDDVEQVNRTLIAMREMGIQLSIDDFGTGYSSLSYLHRFPMNVLKIDQSFVKDLHLTLENWQIVQTILLLARSLKMDVIAEGIETRQQYDQLKEFGCEYGQGYYMSRPLPAKEAEELLKRNPKW